MTIYTSQMISGAIGQQLSMFSGQMGYGQQLSYPFQQAMYPGTAAPPPMAMPSIGAVQAGSTGRGGIYGEQLAMNMAGAGRIGLGIGSALMPVAGMAAGLPLDPFSAAISAGRVGYGMAGGGIGGVAMGGVAAGAAALPFFAAGQAASTYTGAFTGGMNQQAALNSTMRNNFQFFGGGGPFGRGFNQGQMGQIGQVVSGELRSNAFTSSGELNQLIAGGSEMGAFTAVRDVKQFTQRFRAMLDTLRTVQKELGGTLTDSLTFVRQAQQSGIFRQVDQINFASEIRSAESVTGLGRDQLLSLSSQGAQISRAFGGTGKQGAVGALRSAQTIGAAVQSGVINQEMLSEATGGLTGEDAVRAFATNMIQRTGAFSRRAMGRFSLFAMSNATGTGLDEDMLARFRAGDLTTGEVRRAAHSNVSRMGRARALNREGLLRGALMEEGGQAAQIGMMRLMVGDRVMDQSDDLASLVLQRRFGMSRPEAELNMSLMRNQGRIAEEESFGRVSSQRETAVRRDITENRGLDAFMRHLEHGLAENTGVTKVREMGRSFMSRISSLAERAMNDILGITESSLSQGDRRSLDRMMMGRLSETEARRMAVTSGTQLSADDLFGGKSLAQRTLEGLGIHTPRTAAEAMEARGVHNFRKLEAGQAMAEVQRSIEARRGFVTGRDREQLTALESDSATTLRKIQMAQIQARGAGDESGFYGFTGSSANAVDAFMARRGFAQSGVTPGADALFLSGKRGGRVGVGDILADVGIGALGIAGGAKLGALAGSALGPIGTVAGGLLGGAMGGAAALFGFSQTADAVTDTTAENRLGFIASGGHAAREARRAAAGMDPGMLAEIRRLGGRPTEAAARRGRAAQIAEGLGGLDEGAVQAVLESEDFRSTLGDMSGMTDRRQLMAQLNVMRTHAARLKDPKQATAARSIIGQLESNIQRSGRIGTEFTPGMTEADRLRMTELQGEFYQRQAGLEGLAGRLEEAGAGGIASLMRRAGERMVEFGEGHAESIMASSDIMGRVRSNIAQMDTGSDEYRRVVSALGGAEQGRGMLAGAAHERQLRRALSGKGRRGRVQAEETAFGLATGGALSEMEFDIKGVGRISGGRRNAAQLLARAMRGEHGTEVMQQLQTQLEERGVSGDDAQNLVMSLTSSITGAQGRGVGNIDDLLKTAQSGTAGKALSQIQKEAVQRMQESRDPLGVTRNELLTQIKDKITDVVSLATGANMSVPPSEQGG